MKLLEDIEQEGHELSVRGCGCLGQCGNGPNMHVSPPGVVVRGISTPAAAFRMLREHCNIEVAEESQLFVQVRSACSGGDEEMESMLPAQCLRECGCQPR